jgi:lysozyme
MTYTIKPMVVDLSHYDSASNYNDVVKAGICGCIYKATQGVNYTDPTYVQQQHAAKTAGLLWGAYHFADSSNVNDQINNFMQFACPDPDELFCLDWEDNGGNTMSIDNVKAWIDGVESALGRPEQCVIYSGNTAKEALGSSKDDFLGARRLWLCQYGSTPTVQQSWDKYWLWQYTDGSTGPTPHTISGVGACDINSYDGAKDQLTKEWATGSSTPPPPPPSPVISSTVQILVGVPPGVDIKIRQFQLAGKDQKPTRKRESK